MPFLELNGIRFHYRDWGGDGQPLLLLHGLASTCHIWDLMVPYLGDGLRVVALDQRGHGETEKPETGYDFGQFVADVQAFIGALGLSRPALVGHSWGGNVALEYAATYPDECPALALIDGGFLEISSNPEMTWEQTRELLTPPQFQGVSRDAFLERARERSGLLAWSPEVEQIVLANFSVDEDGFIHPRMPQDKHMLIVRALWEHKPSELYRRVACPVLLVPVWSEPANERMAAMQENKRWALAVAQERLARSRLLNMEDTIHDVPLQRPKELAEAIAAFVQEARIA